MSEQENETQDTPNKKKSTARPIGGVGNMKQYATIGGRHPEVQKSESPDTKISESPDFEISKPSNMKKSKHPDWKQQTIYLPPALTMKVKMHALLQAKELSEVVHEALTEYFQRHPDEQR